MRAGLQRPPTSWWTSSASRGSERIAVDGEELVIGRAVPMHAPPLGRARPCRGCRSAARRGRGRRRATHGCAAQGSCRRQPVFRRADARTSPPCCIAHGRDGGRWCRPREGRAPSRVRDFVLGPYWTDREPHELLTDHPGPAAGRRRAVYRKFRITGAADGWGGRRGRRRGFGSCVVTVGAAGEVSVRRRVRLARRRGRPRRRSRRRGRLHLRRDRVAALQAASGRRIARRTIDAVGVAGTTGAAARRSWTAPPMSARRRGAHDHGADGPDRTAGAADPPCQAPGGHRPRRCNNARRHPHRRGVGERHVGGRHISVRLTTDRVPARRAESHRHEGQLRDRRYVAHVRCWSTAGRSAPAPISPLTSTGTTVHDGRGSDPVRRRPAATLQRRVRRQLRPAVRVLHAGDADGRDRPPRGRPRPYARGGPRGSRGQPLCCTGYAPIVDAVLAAAAAHPGGGVAVRRVMTRPGAGARALSGSPRPPTGRWSPR